MKFYLETKIFRQIFEKQFGCWYTPQVNPGPTAHKIRRKSKTRLNQSIFHHESPAKLQVFRGHLIVTNIHYKREFLPLILGVVKIWFWIRRNIIVLRSAHRRIVLYHGRFGPTFGPIFTRQAVQELLEPWRRDW